MNNGFPNIPSKEDVFRKDGDDYLARIYVAFEYNVLLGSIEIFMNLKNLFMKTLTGGRLPHRSECKVKKIAFGTALFD